ncbi:hypothetical protein [Streptomyces aidingensis]|uniref:Uncharacterized protein n=1 Tax=Streptomyces aidingensis TaxID=910347 RepID=A0A1I1GRS2_9ACTN|nr:hypothetical protein [Streptomyces aidingensis]SFC14191.1 hypothetical protein SAMN05421773_102107 [Streptomyces aidingensis]
MGFWATGAAMAAGRIATRGGTSLGRAVAAALDADEEQRERAGRVTGRVLGALGAAVTGAALLDPAGGAAGAGYTLMTDGGAADPAGADGEVRFGHHTEIQGGSAVSVPDPGESITAADGTQYLSPSDYVNGTNGYTPPK